ncbi:MAG TPA: hypothetical protein VHC48_08575 [Puia sp.]|jgi:hypothetical protein|nr:hypothetical protein [Puia sp.]
MKKVFITTAIFCFALLGAKAQLINTKWSGQVSIPDLRPVLWQFGKDTLRVFFTDSSEKTEIMLYQDNPAGKSLTITKLSGGSPCENGTIGVYGYTIAGDKLSLMPTKDTCNGRSDAIKGVAFARVK